MKKLFVSLVALMAVASLSAQDLSALFNEGASAYGQKDFAGAAAKFEEVLAQDAEGTTDAAVNAKKYLPRCYFMLGGAAFQAKNFDKAAENFTKSAEVAEQFGDIAQANKAKGWIAKTYQVQGGTAYNDKDYAKAAEIFAKGYAADPRNTEMALNLAMSYCESGDYVKGMEVYENIAAMNPDKYAEAVAKAKEMMTFYTNNQVAKMQAANDYDGIIAMADTMLAANPADALAYKVRIQAYNGMKNYDKVIELGEETANAQVDAADRSDVYFLVGAAYNAKYNAGGNKDAALRDKAIAALKKVTEGSNVEAAKKSVEDLTTAAK